MPKYEIDPNKTYTMPTDIQVTKHDNKILIVAPEFANWIVLDSMEQHTIFEFFREGHSIKEAMSDSRFSIQDVNRVVTQIEARKFCTKQVHRSAEDERSMHLYLTNKCNLSCPHCYMFSGKPNQDELNTLEILHLISEYKTIAKGTCITLSGGEPTSHVDFDLIVKTAYDLGLEVKILTNGTQMSPNRIDKLAKYIYSIQISIDGFSEESNSKIRGKDSFQKALSSVEILLEHGVDTAIAITPPIEILKNHIDEYVDFAQKLLSKYQNKPFHIKFAEELMHGRSIDPSKSFNEKYYGLMKMIQERLYGPNYDVMCFVNALKNNIVIDNCMFGNFAVASNGDVFYCARISDLSPLANVRTTSMEAIYEKSKTAEEATIITNLKPCKDCELRFICGGGCRIEEFPELVKRTSFDGFDIDRISPRHCSQNIKSKFYDLMIRSNKYFYSAL